MHLFSITNYKYLCVKHTLIKSKQYFIIALYHALLYYTGISLHIIKKNKIKIKQKYKEF